ncbi:MAG TPA: hypothetical protein VNJ02_18875 [Vicinamibacterales bacterium]|nr:hypothetical protein [Vicinamibacterales bacterium]
MKWLRSRIPPVSATELGVFRVLFGSGVGWILYDMRLPAQPFPPELHLRSQRLAEWEWVHALATRTEQVALLEWSMIALAGVFAVGLLSRLSFAMLVAAATVWTLVRLTHTGVHNWSALFVTLWAMLPVRWGDGFSLDALIRRWRGKAIDPAVRRAAYGYALWIPGLVFGAAMAAAGAAKLTQSGFAWITNASVKYHFLADARSAPVDWGLRVASNHELALALSAAAIVTECGLILAVLVPGWIGRLPFALAAAGLLLGFYFFQNELWLAWWLLCLAFFVPWPGLVRLLTWRWRPPTVNVTRGLAAGQILAIAVVCGLQLAAAILRVEHAPIMSDYPMYSTTYASIEEFEEREAVSPIFHFAVRFADGVQAHASEVFEQLEIDESVREAYRAVERDSTDSARVAPVIAEAERQLVAHYQQPITAIIVLTDQEAFDWATGRFYWKWIRKPVYTFSIPSR